MKFAFTKIATGMAMVLAASSAQAVLTSANTLTIENDAVTADIGTPASPLWTVTSNGTMLDSFFTMGGVKAKQAINTQYAYLDNGASLTLTGAAQSGMTTWVYYGAPGSNETIGTGLSILSASGDTATIDMSGWKVDWNTTQDIPMSTGAWSAGFTNGVGNLTCDAGSGCAAGSAYTLKYTATVPTGDPSGFGTVKYYAEIHGTVGAVPEASTYGMMLAGLGLVGFAVRRRKQVF